MIPNPVERTPAEVLAWLESLRIPDFMPDGREQPPCRNGIPPYACPAAVDFVTLVKDQRAQLNAGQPLHP